MMCKPKLKCLLLGAIFIFVFNVCFFATLWRHSLKVVHHHGLQDGHVSEINQQQYTPITLFTTFTDNSQQLTTQQSNIIQNWASLLPWIRPVLFVVKESEGGFADHARRYGWEVLPVTDVNRYNFPVLSAMFTKVFQSYNSSFYGFATEVLFSNDLTQTMRCIHSSLHLLNRTVVVGRRRNWGITKRNYQKKTRPTPPEVLWEPAQVASKGEGLALWRTDSISYILCSRDVKSWWSSLPVSVVVGRVAWDNYVLTLALNNLTVVDASYTIMALHQPPNPKFKRKMTADTFYNKRLIGPNFPYQNGTTSRAIYETRSDIFRKVFVKRKYKPLISFKPKPKD